jgi:hypothetical protein
MIDNEIGKFFPPAATFAGYIFMVLGVLFMFTNPPVGIVGALVGVFAGFARSGAQIDSKSRRFREYTGLFGIKVGKWEAMDGFASVSVVRNRVTTTAFSRANRSATTSDDLFYDVCLLDKTHRNKRVVQRLTDETISVDGATKLAEVLGLEYVPYNPEISEATRARR